MTDTLAYPRRDFLKRAVALGAAAGMVRSGASFGAESGASPVWQIGCYTRPWDQQEYQVALDAIAEAGYKYVGLMTTKPPMKFVISVATTPEEALKIAEEIKKRKLIVASVYGGDIPVAKSLEAGIEGMKKLIDNCAAVGAGNLLMGGTGEKLFEVYYKAIAECCGYAAEKKIGISVKPHGGLNSTGPQCRKIIETVGHKNFGLWYDPGNIFYYSDGKLDPVDDAATVDGIVVGMSVKDFQPPKSVSVTPGDGKVNFAAVLARLKQGGFKSGPLIVETLAPGDAAQILAEAKKARAFIEKLVAQL
ncbi:MAG: sugar phosphate isomerase/epimerase [Candidatus Sumerlaeota bacterium]|nr:sugar phosphate isomerase/epimerase [Candidatus Sumerlaeota bacterium]